MNRQKRVHASTEKPNTDQQVPKEQDKSKDQPEPQDQNRPQNPQAQEQIPENVQTSDTVIQNVTIALGAVALVVIVLVIGIFLYWRCKKNKSRKNRDKQPGKEAEKRSISPAASETLGNGKYAYIATSLKVNSIIRTFVL